MNQGNLKIPSTLLIREYQVLASEAWRNNGYKGIYAMATGTGKTITSIFSLCQLQELENVFTIIVCPYNHLVLQWTELLRSFNANPIMCNSMALDWKDRLQSEVDSFNYNRSTNPIVVMSNSSFVLDYSQSVLSTIIGKKLLIADEVHNFGAEKISTVLNESYEYRLGLSATPQRYFDQDGTAAIYKFFKKDVFIFTLEEAIKQGFLTKYYYYPIKVYLTSKEYSEYIRLTNIIASISSKKEKSKAEILLAKRARIVQSAQGKLDALDSLVLSMNESERANTLVYCGSTKKENESQINMVCDLLGNKLGIIIGKYTFDEAAINKRRIIDYFKKGEIYKMVVAIKCLDEGIDIPRVDKAIIMASSSNNKEYVQRRGRILRKFEGKDLSIIYDFVVVPPKHRSIFRPDKVTISLISKEFERVKEYSQLAENSTISDEFIGMVRDEFNINEEGL